MPVIRSLIVVSLGLLMVACDVDLTQNLSRTAADPTTAVAKAYSFETSGAVRLAWDADTGADKYVVLRDTTALGTGQTEIYRGTASGFIDAGLSSGNIYFYWLGKIKGNKAFPLSQPVMGVAGTTLLDSQEPNSTIATAKNPMATHTYQASLQGYQWVSGSLKYQYIDVDYYAVTVEPRTSYYMTYTTNSNLGAGDAVLLIDGNVTPTNLTTGATIQLDNYDLTPKTMYFSITFNALNLVGTGGKTGTYTLAFAQTVPVI